MARSHGPGVNLGRESRLQRDPDAQEPETPVAVIRVIERRHPVVVVVERLMVVSALVNASPGLIRRRRTPVPATIATGIPPRAAAVNTRTTPAARPLLRSTRPTRASGTSWAAVGAARPARTLLGSTRTLLWTIGTPRRAPGTTRSAARSALPLAILKSTGWGTGLRCRNAGTQAQTTETHRDRYRASAGHTLDIHHELPFGVLTDPLINPDR